MPRSKYERDRERRTNRRVKDVCIGRKKATDAITEELVEEVVDQAGKWIERGGIQRLLRVLTVILCMFIRLLI